MGHPRGGPEGRRGSTGTAERQSRCAHLGQRRNGASAMRSPGRSPLTKLLTFRHPVATRLFSYWPPEKRWLFMRGVPCSVIGDLCFFLFFFILPSAPLPLSVYLSSVGDTFSALISDNCQISISALVFPFVICNSVSDIRTIIYNIVVLIPSVQSCNWQ